MSQHPPHEDRWQEALRQKTQELQRCQEKHGLRSCLACEKILGCTVRNAYVNAVYESMNKGRGGGFEF
ncbi:hypothetical protein [Nitratifractor sp.]|uniref:hypothetical protein n=1 Tax=Nitratifractor sp. TaxID=2268144 RepID=UPI0025E6EDE5|nr:hypothetical protein [Nitratifractor sp.]